MSDKIIMNTINNQQSDFVMQLMLIDVFQNGNIEKSDYKFLKNLYESDHINLIDIETIEKDDLQNIFFDFLEQYNDELNIISLRKKLNIELKNNNNNTKRNKI